MEAPANKLICVLTDPECRNLGTTFDLPQDSGPKSLHALVNTVVGNEEKIPYTFYIDDQELVGELVAHLLKNNVSVEQVVQIVCHPQAVLRIRPVTRCSATISGHSEAILNVSVSPDSQQLATGSGDTTVRFWDIHTQTPIHSGTGHKTWVLHIAWSPDGKQLVSGSKDGEIRLWEPSTGKAVGLPLNSHKKWIMGLAWEPAHLQFPCRRFASASKDGDVRIWDTVLRKSVLCLTGHTLAVTSVKWGGNGRIYSGSQDCTMKVWDSVHGKLVRELKGHGHWVNSLALSTEYVVRTGPFDHTGKVPSSPEEAKLVALERYNAAKGYGSERLVSGSDDFTMCMWEPALGKHA